MTVFAAADGGYRMNATSSIDRAIRLSTAAAVLAVVGIAAHVSYWHERPASGAELPDRVPEPVRDAGKSRVQPVAEAAVRDAPIAAGQRQVVTGRRRRAPCGLLPRTLLAWRQRGSNEPRAR